MKRLSTLLGLFLIAGMFSASAQTVPNSGFENWSNVNTVNGWQNNNTTVYFLRQSTDKHSGTYAAEISTKANGSAGNLSGILTLGTVNITTQSVTGGRPISSQPTDLHGWYKYTAGNASDNMVVNVIMTKWTGTSRITICNASFNSTAGQTVSTYTQFTVPLTYSPPALIPDTYNIIVKSSKTTAYLNSIALVDDLAFTPATTGINETSAFVPDLYPNPANDKIFLKLNGEEYNVNIINLIGKNVYTTKTSNKEISVATDQLPVGVYFVNVYNKEHQHTTKLLINR